MNILLISHELSPFRGSECAVGWNFCLELSKFNKIIVLHADSNQFNSISYSNDISEFIQNNPEILNQINFIGVSQPILTKFISFVNSKLFFNKFAIGFKPFFFIGAFFWEIKAFFVAKKILKYNNINILHKLTPISFRTGGIWALFKIPIIIGPTSGVANIPYGFYNKLSFKAKTIDILRRLSSFFTKNISLLEKLKITSVKGIIAVTNADYNYYSKYINHIIKIPEVGCIDFPSFLNYKRPTNKILKLISIGRFDELKSYDILFEVISRTYHDFELTIIGSGPLKNFIINKYKNVIDDKNIIIINIISRQEIFRKLYESDLLIHTSIKEATASVVMEALSVSTPVLCHNSFSLEYVIDNTCGFKVNLKSTNYSIINFTALLNIILSDPNHLFKMRELAHKKALDFSWKNLGIRVNKFYENILNEDSNNS